MAATLAPGVIHDHLASHAPLAGMAPLTGPGPGAVVAGPAAHPVIHGPDIAVPARPTADTQSRPVVESISAPSQPLAQEVLDGVRRMGDAMTVPAVGQSGPQVAWPLRGVELAFTFLLAVLAAAALTLPRQGVRRRSTVGRPV